MTQPAVAADPLADALKEHFGYDRFRPLQREIIEAALAGRDVFALLPTGGGKSLCFQLPALLREGLTVVVSPLIALMKDQVDQLESAGIRATYLNSTLGEGESRRRLRGLHDGEYRLLYAAPERLLLDSWRENLQAWNVSALAVDEAHCISEWGHDFRPEYRQIAGLREWLPDVPVMALTATATERVREDIVDRLQLRDPARFVASFYRSNLHYRVEAKAKPVHQIARFLKDHPQDSGIVYCFSRAASQRLADSLTSIGHPARPYHAGLSSAERAENQDLFLRDEIRIICATIAFGMGINKPNVRWVIHHDLPKNLEGYYQETGRAGRDGLPAQCLLLYSPGDVAKQRHFIEEVSDEAERHALSRQLAQMLDFAESPGCRWTHLLSYFGEQMPDGCGVCDNCQTPPESSDATVDAQKLLSCVVRIERASRFSVGLGHVADILTGSRSEKVLRWHHDQLSTHGVGADRPRAYWMQLGRELIRLGLLTQAVGKFPTIQSTADGLDALKSRRIIRVTEKPVTPAAKKKSGRQTSSLLNLTDTEQTRFEKLRACRKRLADERGVPAYVILGDATLRQMAQSVPRTRDELEMISGWGVKKLEQFGETFLDALSPEKP